MATYKSSVSIIDSRTIYSSRRLDPEYFHPNYVAMINSLRQINSTQIKDFHPQINRGKLPDYFPQGKIGVIKSAKIQNGFIDESDEFVSENFILENPEAVVRFNDILVNSTGRGTLGRSSLFARNDMGYVIDGHVSKISQPNNISTNYLAVYLLTKFGFKQLDTMARGSSGQTEIYPEDIESVFVPMLNVNVIEKIDEECNSLYKLVEETKNFYTDAEQELLERLDWNSFNKNHVLSYLRSSKEIFESSRLDPEFYQPKFIELKRFLQSKGGKMISEFCPIPRRGVSPVYDENGSVSLINSQHLGANGIIDLDALQKTNWSYYPKELIPNFVVHNHNILTYATGAYIGRTNCWLEEEDACAGIDCIITKPRQDICNSVYLSLFLNSEPGLMQANQQASGSAQRHLYPADISSFVVFIPQNSTGKSDIEWQKKLADKVIAGYDAKKLAKKKLKDAIAMVETEIERMILKN